MENETKRTVLITGFGPFRGHAINASWEAVKLLPDLFKTHEKSSEVNLHIEEIQVAYKEVDEKIKTLWEKHKPFLVIHVGVNAHLEDCITLEYQAHNFGYKSPDIYQEYPKEIDNDKQQILNTNCRLDKICQAVNEHSAINLKAKVSHNAGRYLCEYIYYQSLSLKEPEVLFIHVPDMCNVPSLQTSQAIFEVLIHLLDTLK